METTTSSVAMKQYFNQIDSTIKKAYELAEKARAKGYDPEDTAPMPLARNMAERVEKLVAIAAPQIKDTKLPNRIEELEDTFGKLDWRVALTVSLEVAQEKFCKFPDKIAAMEAAIRVGLAYLTLGVVASPIEGFVELQIKKTQDNKDYFCLMFSGPIRSAGGTAASVSVLVADYIRKKMGYAAYDPTQQEVLRSTTELYDYHDRITNLQYLPSPEEIEFLAKHLPVQISGDPSEKIEVSNYKDLPRIDTNKIRNGHCLVMGECLAQKAEKVAKQLSEWAEEFDLGHWLFLKEFVALQKTVKAKGKAKEQQEKIAPNYTYIQDLVAGRPILTHPMRLGGFRLRYGRTRTTGYSASAIHPATMVILDKYIAVGTQLKLERPGKATTVTICDSIHGPIIKLNNGNVLSLSSMQEAKAINTEISEILFLGDLLINYGDFYNRAHCLAPVGYCEEYWVLELQQAIIKKQGKLEIEQLAKETNIKQERLSLLIEKPLEQKPTPEEALTLAKHLDIPLHPSYTYAFKSSTKEDLLYFLDSLAKAKEQAKEQEKIILEKDERLKTILETLLIPYLFVNNEYVVLESKEKKIIEALFPSPKKQREKIQAAKETDVLTLLNYHTQILIKDFLGLAIGARMGRPEKAKMRKLTGSPHVLFPVGKEGGRLRSFQAAMEKGSISSEFPSFYCQACKNDTIFGVCELCDKKTIKSYFCNLCGTILEPICKKHGKTTGHRKKNIAIDHFFKQALKKLKIKNVPDLIKGVRGTSNKEHIPEHLSKGILRAKHRIHVNKDGTIRYDMTQLPITHFTPKEIGTTINQLKELGYTQDTYQQPLTKEDQIVEIKPQDIILPACPDSPEEASDEILFRTSQFIDELLTSLYNLPTYYKAKTKEEMRGCLVVVLAPHTSAAIAARIIGFSKTQGFFAHPLLHAATRRDCDGDEASITLLVDVLLNFSPKFLPDTRGATQDAPLVLTSQLVPSEVDDMVFDLDVGSSYPYEFYEASNSYAYPWDIKIEQLGKHLNTPAQYEGMKFTHPTTSINEGITCSAYKTLPSMEEKLLGQMKLAEKIRAVDQDDVARLVIEKHFLRDIKGNLRKFSQQRFRCIACNEKFRRPPLSGMCTTCKGKIVFTVSEGSIVKYLEPALSLAKKYNTPIYLKQTLELTKRRIEDVFGKQDEKQAALGQWF